MSQYGSYEDIENRIELALAAVDCGSCEDLAAAARQFHVPRSRLYRRAKGSSSRSTRPQTNLRLSELQEQSLINYIKQCDSSGFSAMYFMVHRTAEVILNADIYPPLLPQFLGRDWVKRLLQRRPELYKITQKPKDKDRIAAQDFGVVEAFFRKLRALMYEHGIQPPDIWNFDETGFRLGVGGNQIVIVYGSRGREGITVQTETNRDYLTSVEAISAGGAAIPPMLILRAKVHLCQWYNSTELPDDYLLAVSDSGYNNDELTLEWVKHFDKYSKLTQVGSRRLLIFDGFGGHMTR